MLRQVVLDGLCGIGASAVFLILSWWVLNRPIFEYTLLHPASKVVLIAGAVAGWYYQLSLYVS